MTSILKKYKAIVIIFILITIVLNTQSALADETNWKIYDENRKNVGDINENIVVRIIGGLFNTIANGILKLTEYAGFYTIEQLVFDEEVVIKNEKTGEMKKIKADTAEVFNKDEWNKVINPLYQFFLVIATGLCVYQLVTILIGFRMVSNSISPGKVASLSETFWNLLVVIIFIWQMPTLFKMLADLNTAFINQIKDYLIRNEYYGQVITPLSSSITMLNPYNNSILDGLIKLAFAGLMLYMNFLYMVRKFIIGILLIISPIVSWAWISKNTRTPVMLMLSEIISNTFMSLSHAIVLLFYAQLYAANPYGLLSTWWAKLFTIGLLVPTASLLRRLITGWFNLIGANEEQWAGQAMAGLSTLATVGAIMTGVVLDKTMSSPKKTQRTKIENIAKDIRNTPGTEAIATAGEEFGSPAINSLGTIRKGTNLIDDEGAQIISATGEPLLQSENLSPSVGTPLNKTIENLATATEATTESEAPTIQTAPSYDPFKGVDITKLKVATDFDEIINNFDDVEKTLKEMGFKGTIIKDLSEKEQVTGLSKEPVTNKKNLFERMSPVAKDVMHITGRAMGRTTVEMIKAAAIGIGTTAGAVYGMGMGNSSSMAKMGYDISLAIVNKVESGVIQAKDVFYIARNRRLNNNNNIPNNIETH
ncbi:MAG: hypothetical protein ACPLRZ_11655 [Thermovenabulum sp.]|uniref:hypothetical protein n=1 Tax=Thermovenabulum sp. TaxID=3100335 RepID=UPI003C79C0FE